MHIESTYTKSYYKYINQYHNNNLNQSDPTRLKLLFHISHPKKLIILSYYYYFKFSEKIETTLLGLQLRMN